MESEVKGINNNTLENKPVKYRFVLSINNNTIENKAVKPVIFYVRYSVSQYIWS